MRNGLPALLLLAAAGGAAAQQSKGDAQHVTAPGLPGQANKDVVVRPSGTLKDTGWGIVYQGNAPPPRLVRVPAPGQSDAGADVPPVPHMAPSAPAVPSGPSIVNAAYVVVRGSVVRYEPGVALTLLDARTQRERRVPLAKNAKVYAGIKTGDAVEVHIPFDEGSDARTADRVEPRKAAAAPPASRVGKRRTGSICF